MLSLQLCCVTYYCCHKIRRMSSSKYFLILLALLPTIENVSALTCFVSNYKNIKWNETGHNLEYKVKDCKSSKVREEVTYTLQKSIEKSKSGDDEESVEKTIFSCFTLRVKITNANIVELTGCVPKSKCEILKQKLFDQTSTTLPSHDYIACDECAENRCNKPKEEGFVLATDSRSIASKGKFSIMYFSIMYLVLSVRT